MSATLTPKLNPSLGVLDVRVFGDSATHTAMHCWCHASYNRVSVYTLRKLWIQGLNLMLWIVSQILVFAVTRATSPACC